MRRQFLFAVLAVLLVQLSGCAGKGTSPLLTRNGTVSKREPIRDPAGPIPAPTLPPNMASAPAQAAPPADRSAAVAYTVKCTVENNAAQPPAKVAPKQPEKTAADKSGKTPPAPDGSELVAAFEKSSQLSRLADKPPDSLTGLEQRLSVSLKEAKDILNGNGYYAGTVSGWLEPAGKDGQAGTSVVARVNFVPGPRYVMGKTTVRENRPPPQPGTEGRTGETAPLPSSLADVKLPEGAPAVASDVLAAVDRVLEVYQDNGYPFAAIASTRYRVDHDRRALDADIVVSPGAFVRMGEVERHGAPSVRDSYVLALRSWKIGQPWSASKVEAFQDALRQSGLFQSIEAKPAENAGPDGQRDVVTTLESAPERTVGGALKYHSDFGPGVQAYWEHRNFTGRGDLLRLEAPIWADMQELTASYRLPFFLRKDQNFLLKGGLLNQDLKAYSLQSAAVSAGLERRFSHRWTGSAMISAEGGSIKEPDKPRREYVMYGLPLGLTWNDANSLLDATKGTRMMLSVAPYTGEFGGGPFSILRSRLDGQAFLPLSGEDTVVLALRGALGAVAGASAQQIPPSVRFYSGGGGSVRGYAYQSLGPRDSDNKPLGGNALAETSAEVRWKLTPEWGLVTFVDGGTAIDEPLQNPNLDMRWGAGIGVRYYTAIGPIRLDLATPLTPRSDDDALQVYISIGQSF